MATIETKYVDVGFFNGGSKFPNQYGFNSPISTGTLSNTANGASDPDVSGIYSGVDCLQVVWFSTNTIQFQVETVQSNSGWDSITIGSTTLSRTAASFSTSSTGNGSTSWTWSSQSNPFGTTVGADVLVTWDDGQASIVAPTASNVTVNDPDSNTYTATFNLSNAGSGGTLQYAIEKNDSTPDNWTNAASDTQTTFTANFTRTATPGTIYAQARRSATDTSSIVSVAGRGIIDPASITCSNQTIANTFTGPLSVAITGGIQTHEAYTVSETTGLASANVVANSIDTIIPYDGSNFSIPDVNLPTVAQSPKSFYLYAARYGSSGGDGAFDEVGSFTITREAAQAPAAPTDISFGADPGTSSDTVSIACTASGGGSGTLQVSENNSTWFANGSSFTFTRGTAKTIYARVNGGANGVSSSYSEANTVGFLAPDTTITAIGTQVLAQADTSFNITIANGSSHTVYQVRVNSYTGTIVGQLTGNGSLPVSDAPAQGSSKTYYMTAYRLENQGGDDTDRTNIQSFVAQRQNHVITAPTSINEGSAGTMNVATNFVSNGTTLYWGLDSTSDYATSQGTVSISSNAGSFTVTPSADSSTEGAETDTIRLYTDSGRTVEVSNDTFTINDTSTGGSQGGQAGDGTGTYGLEIYGPDGTTVVFSSNFRSSNNIITDYNVTLNASASTSYTGITDANDSTKVGVRVTGNSDNSATATITRSTANGGTVTVTNPSTSQRTYDIFIYRIG